MRSSLTIRRSSPSRTATKSQLDKTAQDLRDKRLLIFEADKLTRVELTAKGQHVEFGRNDEKEWQIVKPKPQRADNGQVEELVRKSGTPHGYFTAR